MPSDGSDILYRCNVTWLHDGQNCITSFFFRSKPTSPLATIPLELSDLHDDIRNHLLSALRGVMSQDCQLLTSVLFNLNGGQFYQDVRNYVGQYGTVTQGSLPSVLALVLSWRTAYRGRRVHGRTYVPAVPILWQQGNVLTAAGQAALDNAGSLIVSFFGDAGTCRSAWLVCYSRKNGTHVDPGPPPTVVYSPLSGIPVTRYVADNTIYTQRHRLSGRGI